MNWAVLIVGLLDIARLLLVMAAKRQSVSTADLERINVSFRNWATDLDKANAAADAVRNGGGVRVDQDPFNRDNSSPSQ